MPKISLLDKVSKVIEKFFAIEKSFVLGWKASFAIVCSFMMSFVSLPNTIQFTPANCKERIAPLAKPSAL